MRRKQEAGRVGDLCAGPIASAASFLGVEGERSAAQALSLPETVLSPSALTRAPGSGAGEDCDARGQRSRHHHGSLELATSAFADPLLRAFARPVGGAGVDTFAPAIPPSWPAEVLRIVKRLAWGGDRDCGTAYIEFGEGPLAGATLTIESSAGGVSLVLELPSGSERRDWEQRLEQRLARRGLRVDSVSVR